LLSAFTQQLPPIEQVAAPLSSILQQSLPIALHESPQQAIAAFILVDSPELLGEFALQPTIPEARAAVMRIEIRWLRMRNLFLPKSKVDDATCRRSAELPRY
jgi:hypothetical protein